jgi:glutathione synthase/RimK-type ligase-like ATP-grasp enzyme
MEKIKIAIDGYDNEISGFKHRWIEYCKKNNLAYEVVNSYDNDIVDKLLNFDLFLWNFHNTDYRDALFAKQLIYSIQKAGKKVFPDFNTVWHFDDKVGQKYLLEAVKLPMVKSYVFYTKTEALNWVEKTSFPKVFKLRGGAGSSNVKLARTKNDAKSFVNKAFGKGFKQTDSVALLKERFRKYKEGKISFPAFIKSFGRLFIQSSYAKMGAIEKGYIYFQEFIPSNSYDIRVIVIGSRAFAIKRLVRENDFRASGSGNIQYEKELFDEKCISLSFECSRVLNTQCVAIDYVFDQDNSPLIVEISYGFNASGYDKCPGFWDENLNWVEGSFNPQEWMIEDLINSI